MGLGWRGGNVGMNWILWLGCVWREEGGIFFRGSKGCHKSVIGETTNAWHADVKISHNPKRHTDWHVVGYGGEGEERGVSGKLRPVQPDLLTWPVPYLIVHNYNFSHWQELQIYCQIVIPVIVLDNKVTIMYACFFSFWCGFWFVLRCLTLLKNAK